MTSFTKLPLNTKEQIELLQKKGMTFSNFEQAEHFLKHTNYYRLSAYWKILEFKNAQGHTSFLENTSFKTIIHLYEFDKKLRLLLTPLIETFEVSMRSIWAYEISVGLKKSHSYLDISIYEEKKYEKISENIEQLRQKFIVSDEDYSKHYRTKYKTPEMPPTWTICELFTFGNLMNFYIALDPHYRRKISEYYEIDELVFTSFVRNFLRVRNICAHHGRLWNTKLNTCSIRFPKSKHNNNVKLVESINYQNNENIYNSIVFLLHLKNLISLDNSWANEFISFVNNSISSKFITKTQLEKSMGFPLNWENLPLWKVK